jgi:hypothetical protein
VLQAATRRSSTCSTWRACPTAGRTSGRGFERKAPSGNAVAQLDDFAPEKAKPAQWFGSVTGAFSASAPDACP